MPEHMVN